LLNVFGLIATFWEIIIKEVIVQWAIRFRAAHAFLATHSD
jgi:hypothetical protein